MIYETPEASEPLTQGDIVTDCPILSWECPAAGAPLESASINVRAVVLTQACDLVQAKATPVLVAVVRQVQHLVERGALQSKMIRDQIRMHRVYGWHFLPAGTGVDESIVDLRDLHTLPRALLDRLIRLGNRVSRLRTPFREHLAQHFSTTYARIGLPEPYPTQTES